MGKKYFSFSWTLFHTVQGLSFKGYNQQAIKKKAREFQKTIYFCLSSMLLDVSFTC